MELIYPEPQTLSSPSSDANPTNAKEDCFIIVVTIATQKKVKWLGEYYMEYTPSTVYFICETGSDFIFPQKSRSD